MSENKEKIDDLRYDVNQSALGFYRWRYDVNLFKDFSIFFLVWKIFFFIFIGIFAITNIADAIRFDNFFFERLLYNLRFQAYIFIGMNVLTALGYLIYALIMGGKYSIEFAMDDKGILHIQLLYQQDKANAISAQLLLLGLASGGMTAAGVAVNSSRTEMYSEFKKVEKVKVYPKRNLIKLNGKFSRNRIYCKKEDITFVSEYIITRCENLKL